MKRILFAMSATLLVAFTTGCPENKKEGNPAPPALGTQIDRSGRPAISTATIATFEADSGTKGARKDAYNAAGPAGWSDFVPDIAGTIAILDSLDETCGNQLLFDTTNGYGSLATVLSDDRIWINAGGTCTEDIQAYLAVEANATGALANDLCGGRTPTMDIAATSYSVLSGVGISGVDDGVAGDDATQSNTTFPFIAAPL